MAGLDNVKNIGKSIFEKSKEIGGKAVERGKEIGGKTIEKGGQVIDEVKIKLEIASLKKEILMSKIKLGDMVYQMGIDMKIESIEELKNKIKGSLDELKYLETKKSK